jgi:hypothetical protein
MNESGSSSPDCAFKEKLKKKVLGTDQSSRLQQHAFNSLLDTLGLQATRSRNARCVEVSPKQVPCENEEMAPTNRSLIGSESPEHKSETGAESESLTGQQSVPYKFLYEYENFESIQVRISSNPRLFMKIMTQLTCTGKNSTKRRCAGVLRTSMDDAHSYKTWSTCSGTFLAGFSSR